MPGFNTLPAVGGGGGQANMTFVASIHMLTYNRSWAQGGTPGYYAMYSTNQENGYAYFVGSGTTTGAPLNRLVNISHSFTRIDVVAPVNDMLSLYKAKVKSTTVFNNALDGFASFPSIITSSGNFVLPNNALPLVNAQLVGGGGGGGHHGGGGGGGGGIVKLTAYQAVGTTSVTIGAAGQSDQQNGGQTFFGNVYALGGGGGGVHGNGGFGSGLNTNGSIVANGGGAGSHSDGSNTGGTGSVQTSTTGLGTVGSPVYFGGHRGGNYSGGANWSYVGAGGGGAGGAGGDRSSSTDVNSAGAGHTSDITGSNVTYSYGGGGSSHSPARNGQHFSTLGSGGGSLYNTSRPGTTGGVIVRYYIP
jgi:hypothetical protein